MGYLHSTFPLSGSRQCAWIRSLLSQEPGGKLGIRGICEYDGFTLAGENESGDLKVIYKWVKNRVRAD